MTAAYYLTSTEELRNRYEITVYQQGWRLGGKGASGRNTERGDRIEEHGLHIWFGWYYNAFHLIREVYDEWEKSPDNPFQRWDQAFTPQRTAVVQQHVIGDGTDKWIKRILTLPQLPGTPGEGEPITELVEHFAAAVEWIKKILTGTEFHKHVDKGPTAENMSERIERLVLGVMNTQGEPGATDTGHSALDLAHNMALQLNPDHTKQSADHHGVIEFLLRTFQEWLHWKPIREIADADNELLFIWHGLDFITASALGLVRDVIPYGMPGFDRINDQNFIEWLEANGAAPDTCWAAPARIIYDLAFGYVGGESKRENAQFAAGAALNIYMRIGLGYKDAPIWRMMGGMGGTIFTPLYEVLGKQRGVKFEFFHRVENLLLSEDGTQVAAVEMRRQARLVNGTYDPLFQLHNFPCWTNEPLWEQLVDGEELKKQGINFESAWCDYSVEPVVLQNGVDFDWVVFGISLGSIPFICKELIERNDRWKTMVNTSATVQTQAMQLWLRPTLSELGWKDGSDVMIVYQEPFNSWGEMSELLPMENWPPADAPGSLEYFCGALEGPDRAPLDNPNYPEETYQRVKQNAMNWLNNYIGQIWPAATSKENPGGLDYQLLIDFNDQKGVERLDFQYLRANVDPSERYVMSLPKTIEHRLRADGSGFSNLVLAGDWLISGVNGGCVEAAVQTGMVASRAICGVPEQIPNYPEA
jgi:uncharacterized protein with NAD-binding domain and iron-sulfur cluster